MTLMTVSGKAAEFYDHAVKRRRRDDAVEGSGWCRRLGEEGTCGPSPVNPTSGGVLHYALRAPLRPLRR